MSSYTIVGLLMPLRTIYLLKVSKCPKLKKRYIRLYSNLKWVETLMETTKIIKRQAAGDKGIESNGFSNKKLSNIEIYGFDYAVLSKATNSKDSKGFHICMLFAGFHLIRWPTVLMFNVIVWMKIDGCKNCITFAETWKSMSNSVKM